MSEKNTLRANGAKHGWKGAKLSDKRREALARATEPDACCYCGAGLYQEEADTYGACCAACYRREINMRGNGLETQPPASDRLTK